ncbi:MAG: hemerythrin domain-containing protein [Candidatus Caldarchaeum sp.]
MRPRRLELEELLKTLVKEHEVVRGLLTKLHTLLQQDKHAEAAQELREFQPYLDQHIIDEEATVLKLFIDSLGRDGAALAVQVFQEHRKIHQLISEMQAMAETAPEKLTEMKGRMAEIFEKHFRAEETEVFPWALKLYKDKRDSMR